MHRFNSNNNNAESPSNPLRARSSLSVSAVDYYLNLPVTGPPSPAMSTVTLTPGRMRNIDQDMETLRASRHDNPFIQQVIASRESLIDSQLDDEDSDNVNLMAKELSLDLDVDPLSMPEMHEHMIRSPPPTTWPKSPNFRAFQFPNGEDETLQVEVCNSSKDKSKSSELKPKHSSWDGSDTSPLKSFSKSHFHHPDRFSLLPSNSLRSAPEDSIRQWTEWLTITIDDYNSGKDRLPMYFLVAVTFLSLAAILFFFMCLFVHLFVKC